VFVRDYEGITVNTKLAQIRALLAKAEATVFEGERDTYNAKANELIARYGIDTALLAAEGQVRDTIGVRDIHIEGPYALDKSSFLNCVYKPLHCQTIQIGNKRQDGSVLVKVHGYDSDLDRAEVLYTSLLVQGTRGMVREALPGRSAASTAANRRAWLLGFGRTVQERLTQAEARAAHDVRAETGDAGPSVALVLVDREWAVAMAFAAAYPNVVSVRRVLRGTGYASGRQAGQRADIGHGRVGGNWSAINS